MKNKKKQKKTKKTKPNTSSWPNADIGPQMVSLVTFFVWSIGDGGLLMDQESEKDRKGEWNGIRTAV